MSVVEDPGVQLPHTALPVSSIADALPHFRRPFAPAAVKFKVQTASERSRKVLIVAHIDARLVIERLNAVVGGAWQESYAAHGRMLGCHLQVFGQSHFDVGQGRDEKAQLSDALKRVAVKFGIGVSVYALPRVYWEIDNNAGVRTWMKQTKDGPKMQAEITPAGMRALQGAPENPEEGSYAWWLREVGERQFGQVLDHGDLFDAGGLEEDAAVTLGDPEQAAEAPAAEVEQVEGEEADALRESARKAFADLKAAAPRRMMPAEFNRKLTAAGGSIAGLEAFVEELNGMLREAGS